MSEPIISILTTAIEHASGASAVVAAYKVTKPFLAKVLGPAADELGEMGRDFVKDFRAKNMETRLANAEKLLNEADITPQIVPPKIFVPLLESASLEDNSHLGELWDYLFANAANPHSRAKIDGNLIDILRQLNYNQSIILIMIAEFLELNNNVESSAEKVDIVLHSQILLKHLRSLHETNPEAIDEITDEDFYVSLDNLARLQLCTLTGRDGLDNSLVDQGKMKEAFVNVQMYHSPGRANVSITYLGLAFLEATSAPAKNKLS